MYDVIIIGAGVVGCSIARELSRYKLSVAVLERSNDVAAGTSKANSAIVHAGYDAKPGTQKAEMNMMGNPMFDDLSRELDFPFKRCGSLILCFDDELRGELEALHRRGEENGVPGLRIVERAELEIMEPNIGAKAVAALYAPTGGIVCPFEMTVAFAENARANGVTFHFECEVTGIEKRDDEFIVTAGDESFRSRILINAAGVHADNIHNMLSAERMHIIPRAGQYFLFDRTVGNLANHTLFQLPSKMGKGVLITPTVDGNLMAGPTATDLDDKYNLSTTIEDAEKLLRSASLTIDNLPMREVITAFTGLRAHNVADDFVIGHVPDVPGMINAAGIESPGLTSSPAIGVTVANLVYDLLSPAKNPNFNGIRHGIPKFREMSTEQRRKAIAQNPSYGKIICRCESVTEAEVLEALKRGARDIDAVKRRTRAGTGRCQGGFCSPSVLSLLSQELGISPTEVTKSGGKSNILIGENKEVHSCK